MRIGRHVRDEHGENIIEVRPLEEGVELNIWRVEQDPSAALTVVLTPEDAQVLGVDLGTLGRWAAGRRSHGKA